MFYSLTGPVAAILPAAAVIDCGGVGYLCSTSRNTLARLKVGERATLLTHLSVREDAVELFGFADAEELNCFRMLIGISGVGPKAALSILSATTPEGFALSVLTGDEKILTGAPGIGKKLAQRIILELGDKLQKAQVSGGLSPRGAEAVAVASDGGALGDALNALIVLGYSRAEATEALRRIDPAGLSVEDVVRQALKALIR